MLGVNHREAGWPRCGEIDIMENVGYDPDTINANIHTEAYNHVKKTNKGAKITVTRPYETFHVYAIEWTPEQHGLLRRRAEVFLVRQREDRRGGLALSTSRST